MKLNRVRRVLTKRLAYLEAKLAAGETPSLREERDALETLLRCQGMLDRGAVEAHVDRCAERVLPAERRTYARARRGDRLAGDVAELVRVAREVGRCA